MEAIAKLRNCPMSARKMRLVADLVRGTGNEANANPVDKALSTLRYTNKEAAKKLEKLLLSAISNWEAKFDMMESADDYELIVKEIQVGEAGMLKRFRPAPHGRAHRIRKRMCHVTLKLENTIPVGVELEEE
ncbi:MAG: 50S ribosomal protein L22 [Bacteroidetes bacterium]|jgi:large subunit ribosomal protein L22|nr:50S ribosomal protein L22 [Bacteroidota bacterium]